MMLILCFSKIVFNKILITLKSIINEQGGYVVFLVLSEYSFIRNFRVGFPHQDFVVPVPLYVAIEYYDCAITMHCCRLTVLKALKNRKNLISFVIDIAFLSFE